MPEKTKVKCPECGTECTIYDGDKKPCPKCGLNVESVYERARHEKALKKVMAGEPEPAPVPKKRTDDPFSPDFEM